MLKQTLGFLNKHCYTIQALQAKWDWVNVRGYVAQKNITFDATVWGTTGHHNNAKRHICPKATDTCSITLRLLHWYSITQHIRVLLAMFCTRNLSMHPHYMLGCLIYSVSIKWVPTEYTYDCKLCFILYIQWGFSTLGKATGTSRKEEIKLQVTLWSIPRTNNNSM